jgi:hypothetical protein
MRAQLVSKTGPPPAVSESAASNAAIATVAQPTINQNFLVEEDTLPDILTGAWPYGQGPPLGGFAPGADPGQTTAQMVMGAEPKVYPQQLVPFFVPDENNTNQSQQPIIIHFVPPVRQGSSATYNRH